jgi:hypothetical protein
MKLATELDVIRQKYWLWRKQVSNLCVCWDTWTESEREREREREREGERKKEREA